MKLYPLRFKEVYKQYIWGGEGFDKLGENPPNNFAAESWEVACHKDGMSVVENGSLRDKTLKELVLQYGSELLGTKVNENTENFPLFVKFINAKNKLSVQVHPDDEYAMEVEGEQGKNEAWIVLNAEYDAQLIIDVKEGVDKKTFEEAINNHNVESCLNSIKVQTGDIINIPAGLVHAIGEGIMLAEIQQNSNITYRVYDYDRKDDNGSLRPLHVEKALEVIDFSPKNTQKKAVGITLKIGENSRRTIAVVNKYFCIETFEVDGVIKEQMTGETFFIYIFIEGKGLIEYDGETIEVEKGDTYLIPANIGEFKVDGRMKFIKAYVPNIEDDIICPLANMGYERHEITSKIDGLSEDI